PSATELPGDAMNRSPFAGLVGETLRESIGIGTLFTLIPAFILTGILGVLGGLLAALIPFPPLAALIMLIAVSPVIGSYGLAAKAGDLGGGFLSGVARGSLLGFVGR